MVKKIIIVIFVAVVFSQFAINSIAKERVQDVNAQVVVYYFHGSFRCSTCRSLEKYAKESIKINFKSELDKRSLVFKIVNIEEKENEHFVEDYQLYSKSLVLSLVKDGKEVKYKNLAKIWEYVSNKEKYVNYVKSEVDAFIKED